MYWTDIDHSFCESSITGLPEYYNSVSSIFIIFFGLYGISNIYNELFVDILYANLTVIGFGSVGYHWYGNIGWGLFDEIPMITAIFIGILYIDYTQSYFIHHSQLDNNQVNRPLQIYQKKAKILSYFSMMIFLIIINIMTNYRKMFPTMFTIIAVYLYYKMYTLVKILDIEFKRQVITKIYNTLLTIVASGSIWTITEISCNHFTYHIFLLGHPLWHFFIGHGFYNLIQVVYYIKQNNAALNLKYNRFYLLHFEKITNNK